MSQFIRIINIASPARKVVVPDIGYILNLHEDIFVDDLRPFALAWNSFTVGDIHWLFVIGDINAIFDPGAGSLSGLVVDFPCETRVQALDTVYLNRVTGKLDLAIGNDKVRANVVGVVKEKLAADTARFVQTGPLAGFTNLVPDTLYWQHPSAEGIITNVCPQIGSNVAAKQVGFALNDKILLINTTIPYLWRTP